MIFATKVHSTLNKREKMDEVTSNVPTILGKLKVQNLFKSFCSKSINLGRGGGSSSSFFVEL